MTVPSGIIVPNAILFGEISSLLREGKEVTLAPGGRSMLPFIVGGRDRVRLRGTGTVAVGDIVLARLADGRYVLHRVLGIEGDTVTLMGDGNLRGREKCGVTDICGTATVCVKPDGTELDLRSASSLRKARIWRRLLPLRRILLGIYKRASS